MELKKLKNYRRCIYVCGRGSRKKTGTNPVEIILAALEMKAYMTNLKETSEAGRDEVLGHQDGNSYRDRCCGVL
jgi:hypothetical protein